MTDRCYKDGPTTCMAKPKVVKNIIKQIKSSQTLSAGDLRLAIMMGMVNADSLAHPGLQRWRLLPADGGPLDPLRPPTDKEHGTIDDAQAARQP